MMSIKLIIAGSVLGVGTVLAALLLTGTPEPDRVQVASRPVPPDVRALVAAMPAQAPAADTAADTAADAGFETAAEREALAAAVLAALARAEDAGTPATAEPAVALRAVTPADAPAFRLDAGADWVAASGLVDPATELRPLPRRN